MTNEKGDESKYQARFDRAASLYRAGDFKSAFQLYHQLAEEGSSSSKRFIGWMYYIGEGVGEDLDKAMHWLREAAETGDPEAQFGVGRIYMARKEYLEAYRWYKSSADQGFLPGVYRLAQLYLSGSGVERDQKKALDMLKSAAQNGHIRSSLDYARLLIKGCQGFLGRLRGIARYFWISVVILVLAIRDRHSERFLY